MSTRKIYHCVVDDTALITNISEIKNWVSHGAITLIIPLYTLERLHLLKKESCQIGMNAREAVKFLDRVTSGKDRSSAESVTLQGSDEEYMTWAGVEGHLILESAEKDNEVEQLGACSTEKEGSEVMVTQSEKESALDSAGGVLSQILLSKLNFAKSPGPVSATATPSASPSSSSPQSSKTSPEVTSAKLAARDSSVIPPVLMPLINAVVWYTHEKTTPSRISEILFLTNNADTATLARKFGVIPKNIHQVRTLVGLEDQEIKNQSKYHKKHPSPPPSTVVEPDTKPLFKYEDDTDEEEVVFKPRGRGVKSMTTSRGNGAASVRSKNSTHRSPVPVFSTPSRPNPVKPEIPTEEIDPDSFDRGGFGRGSTPLMNTGPHTNGHSNSFARGSTTRGSYSASGSSRGGFHRGAPRGFDRGSTRGRGRLFQP